MSEELGKMEKPSAEEFKGKRKLFFVPFIYSDREAPNEYQKKLNNYWKQVENQIEDLESKLGEINRIYHELVPVGGDDGNTAVKELNEQGHNIIKLCMEKGAQLEALEDSDLLTELMDWGKCLTIGLQNEGVIGKVYQSYVEVNKKRNEHISSRIEETLKADEVGILLMREGHQVQFPPDIQVFYIAPPALDEIKRWSREQMERPPEEQKK